MPTTQQSFLPPDISHRRSPLSPAWSRVKTTLSLKGASHQYHLGSAAETLKGCHLGDVRFTDPETVPALAYLLKASQVHSGLRSTVYTVLGGGGGEGGCQAGDQCQCRWPASQLVAHRTNQRAGSLWLWLPRGMGPLAHLIAGFLGTLDSCLLNEQRVPLGQRMLLKSS